MLAFTHPQVNDSEETAGICFHPKAIIFLLQLLLGPAEISFL